MTLFLVTLFLFLLPQKSFSEHSNLESPNLCFRFGVGRGYNRPFSSSPSIIIIWWHFLSHFQPRATTKITFGDTLLSTFWSWAITHLVTLFDPSQFGDTLCLFHFQKKISIKKNSLLIWWHYFWWHFFRFSFPKNQFRNIPTRNRATCASGSGSVGITPAHFPPPPQLLLFGDTFCHTFNRDDN